MKIHVIEEPYYLWEGVFDGDVDYVDYGTTPVCREDALLFTGGSDVTPSFYRRLPIKEAGPFDEYRDMVEKDIFATYPDNLKVGVCRGAQFLHVMNGGVLLQHITHDTHLGSHEVTPEWFSDPVVAHDFNVTSTHHQGIIPSGKGEVMVKEPETEICEVVWYEDTKSFCFQPHPEYGHEPTRALFQLLLGEVT